MASLNARQLISEAYYLAAIVSRGFETVSGAQITDGLALLNDMLALRDVDGVIIPYYTQYQFNTVNGTEKYNVPNLIDIDTITFNDNNVRYVSNQLGSHKYFGTTRADNVDTLPITCHGVRVKGGLDVYFYPIPDKAYDVKIWGKFGFEEITSLDTDLTTIYEKFYLVYMRYALARFICEAYNIDMPQQAFQKLIVLETKMRYVAPKDYSIQKISQFGGGGYMNYGQINLGHGFVPKEFYR